MHSPNGSHYSTRITYSPCMICLNGPCTCSSSVHTDEYDEIVMSSDEEKDNEEQHEEISSQICYHETDDINGSPPYYHKFFTTKDRMLNQCRSEDEKKLFKASFKGNYVEVCNIVRNRTDLPWDLALCCGSMSGNMEVVKLLMAKGANDFNLAIVGASEYGRINIIKFLENKKGGKGSIESLCAAATGGYYDLVDHFWNSGYNNANVGLAGAAKGGRKCMVDYFVNLNANDFDTALVCASYYGHKDLVKFFLAKGAVNINEAKEFTKNTRQNIYHLLCKYEALNNYTKRTSDRLIKRVREYFYDEKLSLKQESNIEQIICQGMDGIYSRILKTIDESVNDENNITSSSLSWAHQERKFILPIKRIRYGN